MTDKELAQALTGALDERIARAEAAAAPRNAVVRLPQLETNPVSVRAVPARQVRWKAAVAALLALVMLGGVGLVAFKLMDRTEPTVPGNTNPNPSVNQTTEPVEPDELPQVEYNEASCTIRVTGTEHYDRLDLSPYLPNAQRLEVEDDEFRLIADVSALRSWTEEVEVDLAAYLPGYLNRLDRSIGFIGQYIAAHAPNEEIAARTRKPVVLNVMGMDSSDYRSLKDQITLSLGAGFRHHGTMYTLALADPKITEWQHLGFAYWVGFCVDPYNSVYAGGTVDPDAETEFMRNYYYMRDYLRLGGTIDRTDPDNQVLLIDANAWYNLVHGTDWAGNVGERGHVYEVHDFSGDPNGEGNDLSLTSAVSFLNYLSTQYGEDKVVAYCFDTCTFEEAFGTDFTSARAAWEQSLMDRFGDGSDETPTESTESTEPIDPALLPQVEYDEESGTLRITGTENYDRLTLPQLNEAKRVEAVDDSFRFIANVDSLKSAIGDPGQYLPGYLDRLDHSIAFIGQFIADRAPNEEIAAQTRKPVTLSVEVLSRISFENSSEQIDLPLGSYFRQHGSYYTLALMNAKGVEWQHLGFAFWVGFCVDPYDSMYENVEITPSYTSPYCADYFRAGGTGKLWEKKEQKLLADVCSWYSLVHGMNWSGTKAERQPVTSWKFFTGYQSGEGNDMSLNMAVSLINYLAERYGEDKVVAYCFDTCTFEEAFGTDFTSARAAWEQSLMDRFGDGSESEP